MSRDATRRRVAELVERCSDGTVTLADGLAGEVPLTALGLDSLGLLRLLDAVEAEYGVELDLGADRRAFETVDGITDLLSGR
jgi:acyl carrier protein